MRRYLIQGLLPLIFCLVPLLTAALIAASMPHRARDFYIEHLSPLDLFILGLGSFLFCVQLVLAWRALRWRGGSFDEAPDPWLNKLGQAAEWFPLLGLIGTVGGIMQTFSGLTATTTQAQIIQNYAVAITATGSGLLMSLLNILPLWVVLIGRGLIVALGGGDASGSLARLPAPSAGPAVPRPGDTGR